MTTTEHVSSTTSTTTGTTTGTGTGAGTAAATGTATGTATDARPEAPTPAELGIGMRFSVHPHCDDFADVVLGALRDAEECGLTRDLVVETDDVSTYVGARAQPAEQLLVAYAAAVVVAAHRRSRGGHVVAHVLLSRGCPGEVSCDLGVTGLPTAEPVDVPLTGVRGAAQWSLYPLLDAHPGGNGRDVTDGTAGTGTRDRADGTGTPDSGHGEHGDHMRLIMQAIETARTRGVAGEPAHYATRLTGDVAQVLATVADAWAAVGAHVPHVVTHLTLSVGSPSEVAA